MKKILFVATGGTIASKKTENGLTPQITPEELISYIPEVEKICGQLQCSAGKLEHAGKGYTGTL